MTFLRSGVFIGNMFLLCLIVIIFVTYSIQKQRVDDLKFQVDQQRADQAIIDRSVSDELEGLEAINELIDKQIEREMRLDGNIYIVPDRLGKDRYYYAKRNDRPRSNSLI